MGARHHVGDPEHDLQGIAHGNLCPAERPRDGHGDGEAKNQGQPPDRHRVADGGPDGWLTEGLTPVRQSPFGVSNEGMHTDIEGLNENPDDGGKEVRAEGNDNGRHNEIPPVASQHGGNPAGGRCGHHNGWDPAPIEMFKSLPASLLTPYGPSQLRVLSQAVQQLEGPLVCTHFQRLTANFLPRSTSVSTFFEPKAMT